MIKVAAVSGYKSHELGIFQQNSPAVKYIKQAIQREIELLAEEGLEWVLISGQLGVELWAAEVVLELKEKYPELKLAVITPFLNQQETWSEKNKEWYISVMNKADFLDSISKKPYENPTQFRLKNNFFIQKSDALLLLYDPEKEGSPKFLLETAKRWQELNTYEIKLITFLDLQEIAEQDQLNEYEY